MSTGKNNALPVNTEKVIDRVIDVYLWINEDLNTEEVKQVGIYLISLADRRATDIEVHYLNRYPEEQYPGIEDIIAGE